MDIWQSALLGVVEGITEFLPISSTGHLILASHILRIPQVAFIKSFEIVIQLGAIASVALLYRRTLWNREALKKIAIAFIPTGIIGLLAYNFAKTYLIGNATVVLWSLFLGGIALILFERWHREPADAAQSISEISYRQAIFIGTFQALAIVPGVSRAGATIIGGLLLGLKRTAIVEFSFLLAIPTMLAASGWDLLQSHSSFSAEQFGMLAIGFVISFIVATFSVKFLLRYVQRHDFTAFGVYRIIIALLFWLVVL